MLRFLQPKNLSSEDSVSIMEAVFSVCVLIDLLRKKFFEPSCTRLFEKFEVKLKGLLFMKKIENQAQ